MLFTLVALAIPLLGLYLYDKVRYKRYKQFGGFPQLPPSLAWGHLALLDKFIKQGAHDRHPDIVFDEMRETIKKPPVTFFDLRPVNRPLVLITNHEVAEQVSRASSQFPTSIPKANLKYLNHVIGEHSMLAAEGEKWKSLRKRFSPGFAPQHLSTLVPSILDKTSLFVQNLERLAKSGEEFKLLPLLVDVTFDIIGAVVMDVDLHAQRVEGKGELIQQFSKLLSYYLDDKADWPWWIIPHIESRRKRLGKRIDVTLEGIIHEKYGQYVNGGQRENKLGSILALSFQDTTELTPELLSTTRDQLKTFLLAGHDTTSTALSWIIYELHRTPHALAALKAELDDVLGPDTDPTSISEKLRGPQKAGILSKLPYLSAVIKEGLRLHPPASTARTSPQGSSFHVKTPDGKSLFADGTILYNCNSIIHRDPVVYGENCNVFVPERWLTSSGSTAPANIPPGAWRPFERGPRSCIGLEFASMELRIILAVIVRRFEFTKVGRGCNALDEKQRPILGEDGQYKVQKELYVTRQITIKPVDGMMMTVS